ncbi:MAG TPA: 30S ribosomal protein S18 [Candidatus Paceibacterota bacterium]|nr:30S ribosomal protein S18 [Candidatus Paceibacterota bacterium]
MKNDFFNVNNIRFVDYKDLENLKRFLNPNGRILSRKRTGLTAKNQRAVAEAIKRSRFLGLLPYIA